MQTQLAEPKPSIRQLFSIWSGIGLQSFGGGASTIFLIRRAFIEQHSWMTAEEFAHDWNLCLFTPGINLIAITVLIGRKLGGTWGIIASLAGLLLPSAAITCLLAVGFKLVQSLPAVQAMLRGIIPATAGIMFLVALRFAQPLLTPLRKEELVRQGISLIIVLGCTLALIVFKLSVIVVLPSAGIAGILCFTPSRATSSARRETQYDD